MSLVFESIFPSGSMIRPDTISAAAIHTRLYAIFLIPRSGSTWLTELAKNTGRLGAPYEWFNPGWMQIEHVHLGCRPPRLRGTLDINDYVNSIVDEGDGVAGVELSLSQAQDLCSRIEGPFDPGWLRASFYLRRRDLVAQAISLYRSDISNVYHSDQHNSDAELHAFSDAEYNYDGIMRAFDALVRQERAFLVFFKECGLHPTPLFYEDMHANPIATLRTLTDSLAIKAPAWVPDTSLNVLRDKKSAFWRDRFLAELPPEARHSIERLLNRS